MIPSRTLLLITNLTFGGAEVQVVRLAIELKARGQDVLVVSLLNPEIWVDVLEMAGVQVLALSMPRGVADPRAVLRLIRIVRRFRPHVLHCHMFHANLLGRIVGAITSVPVQISTIHNLRETSERGGPTWHKEALYRLTDRLADATTTICQSAFTRHVNVGAIPKGRGQVVSNFVDTDTFAPSPERRSMKRDALRVENDFVWIAVGRLVEQKDYPTLLHAMRSLSPERGKLLIAGGGPLESRLRRMCHTLGLTSSVQFVGTGMNMCDLYDAADGFVMSSAFEGLSVALLEASSMGLPAVVTNVGGNSEIVTEERSGFLVEPRNPEALTAAMRLVMRMGRTERAELGENARKDCIARFSSGVVVNSWLTLYTQLYLQRFSQKRSPFPALPETDS